MNLEDCLPPDLRGPATTITRIAAGMSGAGVYRVDAAGQAYVLKVAAETESADDWRRTLQIQRHAADAGLTPRVVHVDEARRAVLTDFVADHSFMVFFRTPATHEAALAQLGRMVRRIHALPVPEDMPGRDALAFLTQVWNGNQVWTGIRTGFALPGFARDVIERVLAEDPPPRERAVVLGHNDLNPSNLIYDGTSIVLLDWAAAGPMDPFHDLATLAVFLRLEDATCVRLLAAYEDAAVGELPARFRYARRVVAALVGAMQLYLARRMGHPGASGEETPEGTMGLGEFYPKLRAGEVKLGTPEGQWAFGLAMLKAGLAL